MNLTHCSLRCGVQCVTDPFKTTLNHYLSKDDANSVESNFIYALCT